MTWRHLVRINDFGEFEICEAYFEGGRMTFQTCESIAPVGDSVDELMNELIMMLHACVDYKQKGYSDGFDDSEACYESNS